MCFVTHGYKVMVFKKYCAVNWLCLLTFLINLCVFWNTLYLEFLIWHKASLNFVSVVRQVWTVKDKQPVDQLCRRKLQHTVCSVCICQMFCSWLFEVWIVVWLESRSKSEFWLDPDRLGPECIKLSLQNRASCYLYCISRSYSCHPFWDVSFFDAFSFGCKCCLGACRVNCLAGVFLVEAWIMWNFITFHLHRARERANAEAPVVNKKLNSPASPQRKKKRGLSSFLSTSDMQLK